MKFYDLGGGKNIRSIWDKYYHDAHGLLYVVDGADGDRWGQSRDLFLAATSHKYLRGKVSRAGPINLLEQRYVRRVCSALGKVTPSFIDHMHVLN